MPIHLKEENNGRLVEVEVCGKLAKSDYELFVPEISKLIQKHGKIDILLEMKDFHGWGMEALWSDMKFDAQHFSDIRRIAMVGDKTWEKWMATFCRPFTTAAIKYFDVAEANQARAWLTIDKH